MFLHVTVGGGGGVQGGGGAGFMWTAATDVECEHARHMQMQVVCVQVKLLVTLLLWLAAAAFGVTGRVRQL